MNVPDALTKLIDALEPFFARAMTVIDSVFGFISTLPGWLWPIVLLVPPAAFGTVYLRWWFGRRARWEQAALLSGMTPLDEKASLGALFPRLSDFAALSESDAVTLWGCEGSRGGRKVWLADFNRRSGKETRGRTVAVLRVAGADWPEMTLIENPGRAPAGKDEPASPEAEFDRTWRVVAPDPDAAGKVLTSAARAGLVRLAATCRELDRRADTFSVRLVLKAANQTGALRVDTAGDDFAVSAPRFLDPAAAGDLLAAAEGACTSLGR